MKSPQELQVRIAALASSLKAGPLSDKAYVGAFVAAGEMQEADAQLFPEFFEDFYTESVNILTSMGKTIEDLNAGRPLSPPQIFEAFRVAHTLKGSAATMGFHLLSSLAHGMEKVFEEMKDSEIRPRREVVALLNESYALVEAVLHGLREPE